MSGQLETVRQLAWTIPNDYCPNTLATPPGAPTANDFGERVVTVATTHGAMLMPRSWGGRFIRIQNTHATNLVYVAASLSSSAEVAPGTAQTPAQYTPASEFASTAGLMIPGATTREVFIPKWPTDKECYMILEASAETECRIGLGRGSI
ncbi:MAG TPA: hypothetical protein VFZ21_30910 [Gemmatimonadaceae bacterium]|nr:hypothetical protein [Gemmatimonadaceae bacterium]